MSNKLLRSFVDSSFNRMCIKMQMADVGSKRMDSLVQFDSTQGGQPRGGTEAQPQV